MLCYTHVVTEKVLSCLLQVRFYFLFQIHFPESTFSFTWVTFSRVTFTFIQVQHKCICYSCDVHVSVTCTTIGVTQWLTNVIKGHCRSLVNNFIQDEIGQLLVNILQTRWQTAFLPSWTGFTRKLRGTWTLLIQPIHENTRIQPW